MEGCREEKNYWLEQCLVLKRKIYLTFDRRKSFSRWKIFPAKRLSIFFWWTLSTIQRRRPFFPWKFFRPKTCNCNLLKRKLFEHNQLDTTRTSLFFTLSLFNWTAASNWDISWTLFWSINFLNLVASSLKPKRKRNNWMVMSSRKPLSWYIIAKRSIKDIFYTLTLFIA